MLKLMLKFSRKFCDFVSVQTARHWFCIGMRRVFGLARRGTRSELITIFRKITSFRLNIDH